MRDQHRAQLAAAQREAADATAAADATRSRDLGDQSAAHRDDLAALNAKHARIARRLQMQQRMQEERAAAGGRGFCALM